MLSSGLRLRAWSRSELATPWPEGLDVPGRCTGGRAFVPRGSDARALSLSAFICLISVRALPSCQSKPITAALGAAPSDARAVRQQPRGREFGAPLRNRRLDMGQLVGIQFVIG